MGPDLLGYLGFNGEWMGSWMAEQHGYTNVAYFEAMAKTKQGMYFSDHADWKLVTQTGKYTRDNVGNYTYEMPEPPHPKALLVNLGFDFAYGAPNLAYLSYIVPPEEAVAAEGVELDAAAALLEKLHGG